MTKKDKAKVLKILYESIVKPLESEGDIVIVDYEQAKKKILENEDD